MIVIADRAAELLPAAAEQDVPAALLAGVQLRIAAPPTVQVLVPVVTGHNRYVVVAPE
jgi:hypothetical protein